MRKTSLEIWREINIEEALNNFEHKDKLNQALDDMLNFRINELDALHICNDLIKDNKVLGDYISSKMIDHARNIMQVLGLTIDGFKGRIEELEEQRRRYEQIRNSTFKKMGGKSVQGSN